MEDMKRDGTKNYSGNYCVMDMVRYFHGYSCKKKRSARRNSILSAWQYYVLFMGQELYDWFVVDVWWVGISSWWIIPGTEDLLPLWHDPMIKFKGKLKLPVAAIPLAAIVGGLYFLIGK